MSLNVRRVVTGHDADGPAVVKIDKSPTCADAFAQVERSSTPRMQVRSNGFRHFRF